MIYARALTISAIIATLFAAGFAQAATDAKPAVETAAAPAPAAADAKKAVVTKKRIKHHAKKKAAHAS